MSFVATLINQPIVQPFLFTNYRHQPNNPSHYLLSSNIQLWQAIMASTAAPGYFEEVKIGPYVLQVKNHNSIQYTIVVFDNIQEYTMLVFNNVQDNAIVVFDSIQKYFIIGWRFTY